MRGWHWLVSLLLVYGWEEIVAAKWTERKARGLKKRQRREAVACGEAAER
jgi:hypothetical protein